MSATVDGTRDRSELNLMLGQPVLAETAMLFRGGVDIML